MVKKAKPAAKLPMNDEEANEQARAEGLRLIFAPGTATGYKGVYKNGADWNKTPFQARVWRDSYTVDILGKFTGPAEAALAFARDLGVEGCAAAKDDAAVGAAYPAGGGEAFLPGQHTVNETSADPLP